MRQKINRVIFILTIIAAALAILNVSLILTKSPSLISLTGFATSTGTVNVSIEAVVSINFTTSHINWSYGQVTSGQTSATLMTDGPSVSNGNWSTTGVSGLVLENIGNVNVSLKVGAGKTALELLGGTDPIYQWNFTEVVGEEGGCTNHTDTNLSLTYYDANASIGVCEVFNYLNDKDSIRIDFKLVIPYNSLTGIREDTITATATAI